MDHEGYKYERIDGGITGALRQEAIDRFNGEKLSADTSECRLSCRSEPGGWGVGARIAGKRAAFLLLRAEQMEDICSEFSEDSGNRMRTGLLEPFPSWQTAEIYAAAAADATYAESEAAGLRQSLLHGGSRAAIGNDYRGIMQLPGEECRTEAERNVSDT